MYYAIYRGYNPTIILITSRGPTCSGCVFCWMCYVTQRLRLECEINRNDFNRKLVNANMIVCSEWDILTNYNYKK